MLPSGYKMTTFSTSREIKASIEGVFSAIGSPERLARWWGPKGFTNEFAVCEVKTGGRWSFIMRGPDGKAYPNESVFAEVTPSKVVIDHVNQPKFRLTIGLKASPAGTLVTWEQAFESADVAASVKSIVVPANEQNLDRLTAEVLRVTSA